MATSRGVIQGYTVVAAVDDRHQIIVEAQAHGTGSEQALLLPVVAATTPLCTPDTLITADAGYHSDAKTSYTDLMKRAIDSERGRALYGDRFATVEPVFGNLRHKQGTGSLHAARAAEGRYAVEALLPGAQHRETGAPTGMRSRRNGAGRP